MFHFRKTQRLIPLTTLMERWNKIHRDKKVVPAFWGAAYLLFVVPLLYRFPSFHWRDLNLGVALVLMLSMILLCILFGVKIQQWYAYSKLLPKMLEYDDLRMIPCLIVAVQNPRGYWLASERLTRYLDELTPDDSALLQEKDYAGLHDCLVTPPFSHEYQGEYNHAYDETQQPLRTAIFRVIERMGHTQSLPAVMKFLKYIVVTPGAKSDILAAQQCRDALLSLQEQARQNASLLRPSQREESSETLLRAAQPAAS